MTFLKKNLFPLLICPLLFSCAAQRYMYSTPAANVCFFKQKNDSKLAVTVFEGGSGKNEDLVRKANNGFDIQAGYAYSDNWAITASYASRTEKDSSFFNYDSPENNSEVNYKRTLFEIGLGRFSFNKDKKSTSNMFFGVGFGNYTINDNGIDTAFLYNRYHKMSFVKLYFQPSYNIVTAKYVHAAVGSRLTLMRYGNSTTNYTTAEKNYWSLDIMDNKMVAFVEPHINLQFGLPEADWIRLELNANFLLFNIGYPEKASRIASRQGGFYVGLSFDPAAAFRK